MRWPLLLVSVSLEGPDGKRQLASIKPMYLIENKDPAAKEIRDVDTGVRSHEGRESKYAPFRRELIGAGEKVTVTWEQSIPRDFFEGVHESAASEAFIYWTRFTQAGHRWEVSYDPQARETSYRVAVEPPATIKKATPDSTASMKRRPRLVPLDADTWQIHPIEDRGGTLMQFPVLPIDCAVANVGDDVALPHDVEATRVSAIPT